MWVLTLTDPNAPKYKNLSEIIIDMNTPGVTVRPIVNMAGGHHFNEVFFDNVRVHKRFLVGEKNKGFYQMLSQVDYERAGLERLMQNYPVLENLKNFVKKNKSLSSNPLIQDKMAGLEIEFEAGRLLCYKVAWTIDQGKIPNPESSISKAFCTSFEQKLGDAATHIIGEYGMVMPGDSDALMDGDIAESYLVSPSYTIQGGASEILKGIIATRGLGLVFNKK
jgi:alkylation response protein AidB-like acyl-CoA dehydrogenase